MRTGGTTHARRRRLPVWAAWRRGTARTLWAGRRDRAVVQLNGSAGRGWRTTVGNTTIRCTYLLSAYVSYIRQREAPIVSHLQENHPFQPL